MAHQSESRVEVPVRLAFRFGLGSLVNFIALFETLTLPSFI